MKKILITTIFILAAAVSFGQALDTVNIGAYNNDPSADKVRTSFIKANRAIKLINTVRLYDLNSAELLILNGALVSTTELNRLVGVTSAVQTQINNKANTTYVDLATSNLQAQINDTTVLDTELVSDIVLIHVGDTTVTAMVGRIAFKTSDTHFYGCRKLTGKKWYVLDN